MCGLCGVATHYMNWQDSKVAKELLILSQLRGMDSTGVFSVFDPVDVGKRRDKHTEMPVLFDKDIYDSTTFLTSAVDEKFRDRLFETSKTRIIAGHCRAATAGKIDKKNAHPFNFPNVIGMHNGTLRGHCDLKYLKEFEVDSQALYKNLDEDGLQETVDRIGNYGGAYALVWFDKRELTLNFFRNDERPLHFMYIDNGRALFWASEPWMLHAVAERNKLNIDEKSFWNLKPMTLFSIPMTGNENLFSEGKPVIKPITVKPKVYQSNYNYSNARDWTRRRLDTETAGFYGEYNDFNGVDLPDANSALPANYPIIIPPVVGAHEDLPLAMLGFQRKPITRTMFQQALMKGCVICSKPPDASVEDIEYQVGWTEPDRVICKSCYDADTPGGKWIKEHLVQNINIKGLPNVG